MTKCVLSSLFLFALCLVPIPQASAVTVKAGASCAKLKAIAIVKGKKFTCVKSGNKLVWDKGVVVKIQNSNPTRKPSVLPVVLNCPVIDSTDKNGISQVRANSLLGMSEGHAQECANSLNWAFQVGQRDSQMFATTKDYLSDRVTVKVILTVVTRVDVG